MEVTDNLKKDHEIISEMLEIMTKISANTKNTQTADVADLDIVINFLQNFCDDYHHIKEEEKLFPIIEKAGIPKQGPISVMIEDHEIGRNTLQKIIEARELIYQNDLAGISSLISSLNFYVELLNSHIYKENIILFPMSERVLQDTQKEEIKVYFEQVFKEKLGDEGLQTYLDQITLLKAKY